MTSKEEAERLYSMMRAQIGAFEKTPHLHITTKAACREAIQFAERSGGDQNYIQEIKLELGKITDPDGKDLG